MAASGISIQLISHPFRSFPLFLSNMIVAIIIMAVMMMMVMMVIIIIVVKKKENRIYISSKVNAKVINSEFLQDFNISTNLWAKLILLRISRF
ncbi:hypothetical protein RhiirA4_11586 [Rhizophagus irregularis]|uniref:Uncharacterized protein n=1 Tax=Rhizophagus irregularis TaxID=588596 RepID=A0A2I1G1T8_9GLOM|nr:hypothetical protein RhiirA4_11586 [Rhizophagus irregularis]